MPPLAQNNPSAPPTNGTVNNIQAQPSMAESTPTGLTMLTAPQPAPQPVAPQAPVATSQAPASPVQPSSTQGNVTLSDGTQLDPSVVSVMKSIASVETGGTMNYNAIGDNGASMGAFQWNNGGKPVPQGQTPANWQTAAAKFLGSANAPMTPENQNYVAYHQILAYKNQGLTPDSIDALWNGAKPDPNNPGQFIHISGQRAQQFTSALQQTVSGQTTGAPAAQTSSALPTYGASFPVSANDNLFVGGLKTLGNVPSSLYGLASGIVGAVAHPINTVGAVGQGIIGGAENLTGMNAGNPDSSQQTANAIGDALATRYGNLGKVANAFGNDPAGVITDILGLAAGGEGLAKMGASAVDMATESKAALAAENAANYASTGLNVMPQVGAARSAVDTGISALNSGAASLAGTLASPITATAGKIGDMVFGGAQNSELAGATARTGIELSPSAYTNNQFINLGDALAATGAGDTQFAARLMKAQTQMQDLAATTVKETMGTTDLATAGENIAKGAQAYGDAMKAQTDALFNTYREVLGGDVAAQTGNSTQLLSDAIEKMKSTGDTTGLKYLQDKLDVLNGANGFKAPTLNTLKDVLSSVGEKNAKAFGDPEAGSIGNTLKGLYGALKDDTRQTLKVQGKPGLLELYDSANASAADGYRALSTAYARKVQKLVENGQQDLIVKSLIRPTMATSDIPRIMEMAGEQGAADIKANFLQNIFDAAKDPNTGNFTPAKINSALKKWGFGTRDDKVQAILGAGAPEIQQIKDLGTLSEGTQKLLDYSKGASDQYLVKQALRLKPFAEGGIFAAGAWKIFTGDVVGGLQLIGADVGMAGASKFLASDTGQAFMRLGIKRGAAIAAEAQKQGLTIPGGNDSIGGNGTNLTRDTNSLSGGLSESGLGNNGGGSGAVNDGSALGESNQLKTVDLNALAKQSNFDINAARQSGYSEQEIQDYLQGKNAGQLALKEGNPNAIPGQTIALPTSARESTLGLNETKNMEATNTTVNPKTGDQYVKNLKTGEMKYVPNTKSARTAPITPKDPLTAEAQKYKTAEEYIKGSGLNIEFARSKLKVAEDGKPITVTVYHGTPDARFAEEFNPNQKGYFKDAPNLTPDNTLWNELNGTTGGGFKTGKGVYDGLSFTDDARVAKSYSDKPAFDSQNSVPMVVERTVTLNKPKVIDIAKGEWNISLEKTIEQAKKEGYDGIVFKNIKDNYHPWTTKNPSNNIIAFSVDQIKTKSQLTSIWNEAHGN